MTDNRLRVVLIFSNREEKVETSHETMIEESAAALNEEIADKIEVTEEANTDLPVVDDLPF